MRDVAMKGIKNTSVHISLVFHHNSLVISLHFDKVETVFQNWNSNLWVKWKRAENVCHKTFKKNACAHI